MSGKGRPLSDEHRAKLSAALKGRKRPRPRLSENELLEREHARRQRLLEGVTLAEAIGVLERHGYDVLLRERHVSAERTGPSARVRPAGSAGTGSGDHRSHGETRNGGPGIGTQAPGKKRDSGSRMSAPTSPPPGAGAHRGDEHEGRRS